MTFISGIGLVTPFGADLDQIWVRLLAGEPPAVEQLTTSLSDRTFPYLAVPRDAIRTYERHPRLRRSSEISHFAVIAGLNAMVDAGIDPKSPPANSGVVFAISSGGVRYTRRFFDGLIHEGSAAASPLLFPETVYNAPASHLAAVLGLDGISYTVVGDSSVGISALAMGVDLLETGQLDHCIVVGAEEADWILCQAFKSWRAFRPSDRLRAFGPARERSTVFSEGAGAIVLSRKGPVEITRIHAGLPFFRQSEAKTALNAVFQDLAHGETTSGVVASANGTALDDVEHQVLDAFFPAAPVYAVKEMLGESLGASALQQIVTGVLALRKQKFPNSDVLPESVLISALGYNAQATGAILASTS
ncbi:MAG TPA: beta-ketoacyl synthase N-terminal-like domain-containing protein [Chthoniobacterales bacterium]